MIEIIQCKESFIDKNQSFLRTSFKESYIHQKEFDRLKKLIEEGSDNINEEIKKSYQNGKINMHEIEKLANNNKSIV